MLSYCLFAEFSPASFSTTSARPVPRDSEFRAYAYSFHPGRSVGRIKLAVMQILKVEGNAHVCHQLSARIHFRLLPVGLGSRDIGRDACVGYADTVGDGPVATPTPGRLVALGQ